MSVRSAGPWRGRVAAGPRRSLILLGFGALLGLALAGFSLFTAKGAKGGLPPEDVALVNQRPILRSDFIAQVEAQAGRPFGQATSAERRRALNDMVREELFVQRGLELDLAASDPDIRTALVAGVERQVEADVTAQQPSEDQLRAFYARRRNAYASEGTMTVHDLTGAPAALAQAAAALRSGRPLAQKAVAASGLKDLRAATGEEFYYAARIHLGAELFAAARGLKPGEVAGPLTAGGAQHLLVMEANVPPKPLSFEDARDRLVQDYLKAEQRRIEAADEAFLRGKAEIVLAPQFR